MTCGFFMSFQFTGYNTIAYDEIAPERMSAATSFYTTFQQLMLSLGICVGAAALQGAMVLRGHATSAALRISPPPSGPWRRSRSGHDLEPAVRAMTPAHEISGHTPRSWPARQVIKAPRGLNS